MKSWLTLLVNTMLVCRVPNSSIVQKLGGSNRRMRCKRPPTYGITVTSLSQTSGETTISYRATNLLHSNLSRTSRGGPRIQSILPSTARATLAVAVSRMRFAARVRGGFAVAVHTYPASPPAPLRGREGPRGCGAVATPAGGGPSDHGVVASAGARRSRDGVRVCGAVRG